MAANSFGCWDEMACGVYFHLTSRTRGFWQRGCHLPNNLFYLVLKRCIAQKDLILGKRIHAITIDSGYEGDAFLATHFIVLFASYGSLEEAMQVFNKVSTPDAYNWATIIFAFARRGEATQAIRLYRQMRESTVQPTNHIYLAALKACAAAGDLVSGKEVHAHVLASPGKPDIFVETGLVDMYAKCGSLENARRIFDRLSRRDVVAWNAMIAGYTQHGMGEESLCLYKWMEQEGHSPDSVTFVCLLQACATVGAEALHQGKRLHGHIEGHGLEDDLDVGVSLVNMYAKCGSLEDARGLFDKLTDRNVVTWNAMLAGYSQQGMGEEALSLFKSMRQVSSLPPDSVTFVCVLQACSTIGEPALHEGKHIHAQIVEQGLQHDLVLAGSLVIMYAKCSSLDDARRVFNSLPDKNVVTWTTMMAAYTQQGVGEEALTLYSSMQQEGLSHPDSVTFQCLLHACAIVGVPSLHQGRELHAQIQKRGLQADVVLGGSLVHMYSKCGSLEDARKVFDTLPERNVVTWNAMLAGYVQQGMHEDALTLYSSLQDEGMTAPDSFTFTCLLQACASVTALPVGKQIHEQVDKCGLQADVVVGTCLIYMYGMCGRPEDARSIFDRLLGRNVVAWNAMLEAYAEQEMGKEVLTLYGSMQKEGITPNAATFVYLLRACGIVAALPVGTQLHMRIMEQGLQADVFVGSALVNMYAKCGCMLDSQQVFDLLRERTIEAWGALISGYTRQGDNDAVFALVDRMRLEGIQPNGTTFLCVLTVCSHVGLVDKGRKYFEAMRTEYGISPTLEHYKCMMNLLGRAGQLDEVLHMAKTMPFPPDVVVWLTLLSACRKWNNVEIGRQAFESAVNMDGKDASPYMLMSNIYAGSQMWEEAKQIQARRVKLGAWKKPGQCWWTDMGGVVHTFEVGDKKHPGSEGIYAKLEELVPKMKKGGSVPNVYLTSQGSRDGG